MPKLTIHPAFGNTPKHRVLRDLNIAFAQSDVAGILQRLTDDVRWQIVGQADLRGKAAVRAALTAMRDTVTIELVIHAIITHGAEGAVNGIITTEQGGAVAFCDVYRFASASSTQISSMTSYAISLNNGD